MPSWAVVVPGRAQEVGSRPFRTLFPRATATCIVMKLARCVDSVGAVLSRIAWYPACVAWTGSPGILAQSIAYLYPPTRWILLQPTRCWITVVNFNDTEFAPIW